MKLNSQFLGELEVNREDIIYFPRGIIGFPNRKEYILLQDQEGGSFWYLQSVQDENLFFLLVEPNQFFPDYKIELQESDLEDIEPREKDLVVLSLVTVPRGDIEHATVNLQGPLVINADKKLGKQVVLHPSPYSTKEPLFPKKQKVSGES